MSEVILFWETVYKQLGEHFPPLSVLEASAIFILKDYLSLKQQKETSWWLQGKNQVLYDEGYK